MKQRLLEIALGLTLLTEQLAWIGILGWGFARFVDWI